MEYAEMCTDIVFLGLLKRNINRNNANDANIVLVGF